MAQRVVRSVVGPSAAAAQPPRESSGGGGGSVPRREFSARTKRLAWERANGFCEGQIHYSEPPYYYRCNAPIDLGEFHYDHIDPDWFSKDNELENCQVLCRQCHLDKTRLDIKNIAKSKRIMNKRMKAKKKRGGFKGWRKFDGTVVHVKR